MIIMFITLMILAGLTYKLGIYSAIFSLVKFALITVFFLAGGFMLWWIWKKNGKRLSRI